MVEGRLYIGTRRYSSWSMRGWLPVKLTGLDVEEIVIALAGGSTPEVKRISPSGFVPYLEHGEIRVWESLAICEYCAELSPSLLPADRRARAHARAISAEMHAGFRELRMAMWINLGANFAGDGRTAGALADISRIEAIWAGTRARYGSGCPYRFGDTFNAADAMYAPVVARFLTWQPEISPGARAYCEAIRAHPLVDQWYRAASEEPATWRLSRFETQP